MDFDIEISPDKAAETVNIMQRSFDRIARSTGATATMTDEEREITHAEAMAAALNVAKPLHDALDLHCAGMSDQNKTVVAFAAASLVFAFHNTLLTHQQKLEMMAGGSTTAVDMAAGAMTVAGLVMASALPDDGTPDFDPDTDPTKPAIGLIVEHMGSKWRVTDVNYYNTAKIKQAVKDGTLGELMGVGPDVKSVISPHKTIKNVHWVLKLEPAGETHETQDHPA